MDRAVSGDQNGFACAGLPNGIRYRQRGSAGTENQNFFVLKRDPGPGSHGQKSGAVRIVAVQ